MANYRRKLYARFFNRPTKPSYEELTETLHSLTELLDEQREIVDAAEELIDAMWLFDAKGQPAITIKTDNPVDAHTIAHRIWALQALIAGTNPPVPVFIEGVYH